MKGGSGKNEKNDEMGLRDGVAVQRFPAARGKRGTGKGIFAARTMMLAGWSGMIFKPCRL
ncbi:MAG: hypothetical protein LBL48_00835 [Azoarcus sp.]|jgi:hypothetical protein|nr:hypothetical protein [Azoarcus sp.]